MSPSDPAAGFCLLGLVDVLPIVAALGDERVENERCFG
jgi:hypothetical protein